MDRSGVIGTVSSCLAMLALVVILVLERLR